MADRVRLGIIGCGMIGSFHAQVVQDVSSIELVAACDIVPEKAGAVAEQYGVAAYGAIADLLAHPGLDAVSVCTPSGMHADHGLLAARAGKHVLVEKPMDVWVEKIDELAAVCTAQGVVLGGIFQNRFPRAVQQVKTAIDDGWLGEIVFANGSCLWLRLQAYYDSGDWRGTWALDGGVLSNQAIHTIDRLLWLVGMQPAVQSAYCPTLARDMEAEDLGVALLRFPNGAAGIIQGTTLANPGLTTAVTICGTKGSVVIEDNRVVYFHADGAPEGLVAVEQQGAGGASADPSAIWGGAHAANIEEFGRAILEGREPWVNAAEARKAVQLLNDIYRAAGVGPYATATA
ncbi:MAG TPA: Gfo/Idh/MocA family oxidoreductase [Armatimonadota bacterium]|nr:Gfo/Idh/MocA family oxidoreductase [Armatimonadota bacterium]HOS42540.1 Gfo/Idh/MocA family oxidoreductase [Armatimonadota bacterium]